jgi:hypothetical protein
MEVSGELHDSAALSQGNTFGTHWIGGFVELRAGLDTVEERKISCLCRESIPAIFPSGIHKHDTDGLCKIEKRVMELCVLQTSSLALYGPVIMINLKLVTLSQIASSWQVLILINMQADSGRIKNWL